MALTVVATSSVAPSSLASIRIAWGNGKAASRSSCAPKSKLAASTAAARLDVVPLDHPPARGGQETVDREAALVEL